MRGNEVKGMEKVGGALPDQAIEIPEKTNMAWEACDRPVEEGRGEQVFFFFEEQKITYRQLQKLVNRIGNGLKRIGVRP